MAAKPCDERERLKEGLRAATIDYVHQVEDTQTAAACGKPGEVVAQQKREQKAEKVYRQQIAALLEHRRDHGC